MKTSKKYRFTHKLPFAHFLNGEHFVVHLVPTLPTGISFSKDREVHIQNDDELNALVASGIIEEVKEPRVFVLAPFEVIENNKQVRRYREVDPNGVYAGMIKAIEQL